MPPEFTGGLGAKGAEALREFARAGGTLVFLNRASEYAIEKFGVKAKNVVANVPPQEFYSPGSLLNARLDLRDPLTRGLPGSHHDLVGSEPGLEHGREVPWQNIPPAAYSRPAGCWGRSASTGKTALIHARYGGGNLMLFGMRPQYRAQSYLTFKLFFNALLLN